MKTEKAFMAWFESRFKSHRRERLTDKRSEALWKRKAKLRDQIFDIENRLQSDNQLIWMRYGLEEGWKAGREYQKGKR